MTARRRFAFGTAAVAASIGFAALGNWQLDRRAWKHALIDRVVSRVHAQPVAPPGPEEWPKVDASTHEYRRVWVAGSYLPRAEALVQASTELGSGWWVLTPLRRADGTVILVNRGFVAPRGRDARTRATAVPSGEVEVVGLLRISERGGGFLRRNDPAADRWYSRDVAAIAAALRLSRVAPFFIDAEWSASAEADAPVGGLTVVDFRDHHLVYAIIWFGLAGLAAAAAVLFARIDRDPLGIDTKDCGA